MSVTRTTNALLPWRAVSVELPPLEPPPQPATRAAASARTAPGLSAPTEQVYEAWGPLRDVQTYAPYGGNPSLARRPAPVRSCGPRSTAVSARGGATPS